MSLKTSASFSLLARDGFLSECCCIQTDDDKPDPQNVIAKKTLDPSTGETTWDLNPFRYSGWSAGLCPYWVLYERGSWYGHHSRIDRTTGELVGLPSSVPGNSYESYILSLIIGPQRWVLMGTITNWEWIKF